VINTPRRLHDIIEVAQNTTSSILTPPSSPEEDYASFNTNVFGTLNVSKALIPHLRSSPHHRTIANFGSIASWTAWPGSALYSGTKFAISGISEAMCAELAPLGIAVTVIEPGFFRTNVLDSGVMVNCQNEIPGYEAVRELRKMLAGADGKQPGDVAKGCKVIVDILLMKGGKDVPMRICLGSDAKGVIGGKCEETLGLLAEWEGVAGATDCEE
jgi:NAD(P)-dependent dehydrogenase (short-subunit alcohol dehydrogenase family)